ncbi:MAG: PQQ-binding-like beta-propeller repeat protein [Ktedonobacteraceae bacterium]
MASVDKKHNANKHDEVQSPTNNDNSYGDVTALMRLASDKYRHGDEAGAEHLFEQVLSINPHSVDANYNLGVAAEQHGDLAKALSYYRAALQAAPSDTDIAAAVDSIKHRLQRQKMVASLWQKPGTLGADGARTFDLTNCSLSIDAPALKDYLVPYPIRTTDGKTGWITCINADQGELNTPAYGDGRIYLGEGKGSSFIDAFDSNNGKLLWHTKLADSSPTCGVYSHGNCAFNTDQSCNILDGATGKIRCSQNLPSLSTMPAIANGSLYVTWEGKDPFGQTAPMRHDDFLTLPPKSLAHEFEQRHPLAFALEDCLLGGSVVGLPLAAKMESEQLNENPHCTGCLACISMQSSSHSWIVDLPGTPVTAPVVIGDKVYVTCQTWRESYILNDLWIIKGVLLCIDANTGAILWRSRAGNMDRAPLIFHDHIIGVKDHNNSRRVDADASADFGDPLPITHEQPACLHGMLITTKGPVVEAREIVTGKLVWQDRFDGLSVDGGFCSPAVGRDNIYLVSKDGYIVSLRSTDGAILFAYATHQPVSYEPCLANGNVYVSTANGLLISLKTANKDADGWYAWGGNSEHTCGAGRLGG